MGSLWREKFQIIESGEGSTAGGGAGIQRMAVVVCDLLLCWEISWGLRKVCLGFAGSLYVQWSMIVLKVWD